MEYVDRAVSEPWESVLFDGPPPSLRSEPPESFRDLNLDQLVAAIIDGRGQYELAPFFYTRLPTPADVRYRHAVLRDLERPPLLAAVNAFAAGMVEVRERLRQMQERRYRYERCAWFRDAAALYCEAIRSLDGELANAELDAAGLIGLREHVSRYAGGDAFGALEREAQAAADALAGVRYSMEIEGTRIRVRRDEDEEDYSAEVLRTFEKFKQGAVKDYRHQFRVLAGLNHVEDAVLERVAELFAVEFKLLLDFCEQHEHFVEDAIGRFDREIQFYLSYLELQRRLEARGLPFCLPEVSDDSKETVARDAFDVALANSLPPETDVVGNNFELRDPERILVVSGPNQGGKTTFARMVGQLHHLAALGLPVPGTSARLYLCDEIFTHFEREEDLATLSGKLEDDLVRIHAILERATADSLVVMNESFTSTTLQDALVLGRAVLEQMIQRELLCVYVTFVDELASLGETTVSMMSTVVPEDPAQRTFKVLRRPADGLAYAAAIADKYGLSYQRVKERIAA